VSLCFIVEPAGIDEPQVGYEVQGFIDGKFDSGYLVTMKLGSQELKGVLYHIPQTPSQSQQTMETPSAIVQSSQRRHRKKSKLAVVDTQKPKCHRSGYNFFFAEQYARLKPEYHGQERSITKKIGHMWSNLTESEKQVTNHHRIISTFFFFSLNQCLLTNLFIITGLSRQRS